MYGILKETLLIAVTIRQSDVDADSTQQSPTVSLNNYTGHNINT